VTVALVNKYPIELNKEKEEEDEKEEEEEEKMSRRQFSKLISLVSI